MPAYNLSLINGSGLTPFLQTVNTNLMYGWYGNLALIALFAILTMAFIRKTDNAKKSLGFSSLMVAVFSVLFRTIDLVPDMTVLVAWIIAGIAMALVILIPD